MEHYAEGRGGLERQARQESAGAPHQRIRRAAKLRKQHAAELAAKKKK
jgi:hypothetical protein